MKEVDFLPEWYKQSRRRQVSLRRQYIALGAIFVVMMGWNMIATHAISKATVELTQTEAKRAEAEDMSREITKIQNQISEIQNKAEFIEQVDSNINVASVLAEVSYLIDRSIVLNEVRFVAEKFTGQHASKSNSTAVRVINQTSNKNRELPLGDVRFKVVIKGIAADASDAADLVCKLEDSPYFRQVYPLYSRNIKVQIAKSSIEDVPITDQSFAKIESGFQASEFEISCYLANYKESIVDN